jgi:hypothetical protein
MLILNARMIDGADSLKAVGLRKASRNAFEPGARNRT